MPTQRQVGKPGTIVDQHDHVSYNPIGHLEALRWFVLSGALTEVIGRQIAIVISYSNWGKLYTRQTLDFANFLKRMGESRRDFLFLVEVVPRHPEKRTGSMLVVRRDDGVGLKLVKFGYARGSPLLAPNSKEILMSTNTWYVNLPNLLERLTRSAYVIGLDSDRASLIGLLEDSARGRRRDELSKLFEAALPTEPQVIPSSIDGEIVFLRVERDLDQLSLVPGPPVVRALEVSAERAVSLKVPADFQNPTKTKLLFE